MKNSCKAGHEFTQENTYNYGNRRHCKTCRKERMQAKRNSNKKGYANSRKTHCPKGHPYDKANTAIFSGRNARVCRECSKLKSKSNRLKKYGLTTESYSTFLDKQNNCCALCLKQFTSTPHIDHDHTTGKVRGLLCYPCNSGLGQFEDDIERLQRAISYLKQY